MAIPLFNSIQLRRIAEVLAEAATHREHSALLAHCRIVEQGGTPKWERILNALSSRQGEDRCGNNVAAYIEAVANPVRFTGRREEFSKLAEQLNQVLLFAGLRLGDDGRLAKAAVAKTLSEAEQRASRLRQALAGRAVHADVLHFCRAELVDGNYFHAVFEATKSVAEKIRGRAGLAEDGAALVDKALCGNKPRLAINSLRSETEQSEQSGFANLVKGMFGTFRNVTAHAPKVLWKIDEQDALDLLTMVSFLHRRLDSASRTPWP